MTKLVLHNMVERKRGAIINIASASGVQPTPMLGLYSATKAFVDTFSHCLQTEYKNKNIIVQVRIVKQKQQRKDNLVNMVRIWLLGLMIRRQHCQSS